MKKGITKAFERLIGYDSEGDAVMIIRPTYVRTSSEKAEFAIRQVDAWRYSEEHNPFFEEEMAKLCLAIQNYYNPGIVLSRQSLIQRMSVIASVVQEGLDDLIKALPPEEKDGKVIGEVTANIGGKKITHDLTTNDIEQEVDEVVGYMN